MFRPGIYPPNTPILARRVIYVALWLASRAKFLIDSRCLPLGKADWSLFLDIHVISALRLRRFPNLKAPRDYNDQIKWLMMFAQHQDMSTCVDKLRVRDYVSRKIGKEHLIPLIATAKTWDVIEPYLSSSKGVLKCAHDSGSALLFDRVNPEFLNELKLKYEKLLSKEYGVGKGEWPYRDATRAFLVEEQLEGATKESLPDDIKVHCVNGQPKLIHIIADRQTVPKQAFFLPNGTRVFPRVKPGRAQIFDFDFTSVREKILPLAQSLSEPFAYVRTDFYLSSNHPYFGEMTFFEEAGLFADPAESRDLAALLNIECTLPSPSLATKATDD